MINGHRLFVDSKTHEKCSVIFHIVMIQSQNGARPGPGDSELARCSGMEELGGCQELGGSFLKKSITGAQNFE
jgi:hypothetical protein